MPGSCPTITLALWRGQLLRMTTFGAPVSLLRPICKLVGNGKQAPPLSNAIGLRNYLKRCLHPSTRRCGGKRAPPQSYKTLARARRGTVFPHRTVSRRFHEEVRRSETTYQFIRGRPYRSWAHFSFPSGLSERTPRSFAANVGTEQTQ